jgi:putative hydrolase of the HAD superfamily
MVEALDTVKAAGYAMACLTNNVVGGDGATPERRAAVAAVMARFDAVIESSKVGCRKPETRFYEIACETLQVSPHECVFLDDLGVNLKPAAAMGMHTIKVINPDDALAALSTALQLSL